MLHLRFKNPVPVQIPHHAPLRHLDSNFPLKHRIERNTERMFQIVSLPQKDGSFVASIVEAPDILVYDRSRKVAEDKATRRFLSIPDPYAYRNHPLAKTKLLNIEMEYDQDAAVFVTFVKEFRRMSTFGPTEDAALDSTAEMIRGYIKSMEANGKKIPIPAAKLAELKRLVGLH